METNTYMIQVNLEVNPDTENVLTFSHKGIEFGRHAHQELTWLEGETCSIAITSIVWKDFIKKTNLADLFKPLRGKLSSTFMRAMYDYKEHLPMLDCDLVTNYWRFFPAAEPDDIMLWAITKVDDAVFRSKKRSDFIVTN